MTIGRIIDVSSIQHEDKPPGQGPAINWSAVRAAGITTAIIKATQGTTYTNPWFHEDVAGALAAGLQVMAYHFAGSGTPQAEAAYFLSVAGHLAQCLDIETSTNATWARAFLLELNRPADELLVYGSASSLVQIHAQLPALAWPAAYGQNYPGWGVLWQFTDAAAIQGIPVSATDEDQWHGSEIQYETLFGTTAPPKELEMLAPTPSGNGFWTCSASGAIITWGDAQYFGGPNTSKTATGWNGPPNLIPGHVIVSITAHPNSQGYWCEDNAGNRYAYGAAPDFASPN